MKFFDRNLVKMFLFSLLTCTLLYVTYGLGFEVFLKHKSFIQYSLYFVFLIGFILSVFFNKGRVFFILLLFFLLNIFLGPVGYELFKGAGAFFLPFSIVFFIISINIIIVSFYRERGIFTTWGLRRILIIFGQLCILYLLVTNKSLYQGLLTCLNSDFLYLGFLQNHFQAAEFLVVLWLLAFLVLLVKGLEQAEDYAFLFLLIQLFVTMFFLKEYPGILLLKFAFLSVLALNIAMIKDFYSMAYHDELTGLPARRALREELLKLGNSYSIAMLDIDFFKKFNDKYGHDIGDQVLKMVAAMMKRTKGGARVFRYGGEEFTIVFAGKGVKEAYDYLEELRRDIADHPFIIRSKKRPPKKPDQGKKTSYPAGTEKTKITVSIGVAEKKASHDNAAEVIKEADQALYRAKKKGRNRVEY